VAVVSENHQILAELLMAESAGSFKVTFQSDATKGLGHGAASILVIDLEALGEDPVEAMNLIMQRAGLTSIIVLYTFCRRAVLIGLSDHGAQLVRKPINPIVLRQLIDNHCRVTRLLTNTRESKTTFDGLPQDGIDHASQFSNAQLARLANAKPQTNCECPNHLAALIANLTAFEDYSVKCSSETPQDAELHGYLHSQTGKARRLIEDCLARLILHDDLKL